MNRLVHLLTGRSVFDNPLVNVPDAPLLRSSADVDAVRAALHLDLDHEVYAHLALLESLGRLALVELVPVWRRGYRLSDLAPSRPRVLNAAFRASDRAPRFNINPVAFPQGKNVELQYLNARQARFIVEGAPLLTVDTRLSNGVLGVDWPAEHDIAGDLLPASPWGPNSVIAFEAWPVRHPYAQIESKLAKNAAAGRLLVGADLAGHHATLTDPAARVALVSVALVYAAHTLNP